LGNKLLPKFIDPLFYHARLHCYELTQLPSDLKSSLPTVEDIEAELKGGLGMIFLGGWNYPLFGGLHL
jgi:hypothetical protein